jgi:hypothetical protein
VSSVGEQWDASIARAALRTARNDLANTRRIRNAPMPPRMDRNYAFWRRVGLDRIARCRAAVRVTEARAAAVMSLAVE